MKIAKKLLIYYLTLLARMQLAKINPKVIGLTGSVGKTTLRDFITAVLSQKYIVKCAQKSMNSDIGVPMAVFDIEPSKNYFLYLMSLLLTPVVKLVFDWEKYDFFIVEKGIEEPGDMDYLGLLTKLDVAILLNIYPVHTANFHGEDPLFGIYKEKFKIFSHLKNNGFGLINVDNPYIAKYLKDIPISSNTRRISSTSRDCEVHFKQTLLDNGTLAVQSENCDYTCHQRLPTQYANSIAISMYIGVFYGVSCTEIQKGLDSFRSEPGRFCYFRGLHDSALLDSTYNSSPYALESLLEYVKAQTEYKRKILCLGDMRELGSLSESEHTRIASNLNTIGDYVFLVGEEMCKHVYPLLALPAEKKRCFKDSLSLGDYLITFVQRGDLVVFKGSQNTIYLEEALKKILADPNDTKNLCRQDAFWTKKKLNYFGVIHLI